MKKSILSFAVALLALPAMAASPFNSGDNKPYLGIRASLDVTIPQKYKIGDAKLDMFGTGPGIGLGVVYNIPIVANLYVEPGLDLYYNTSSIKTDDIESDDFPISVGLKNHSMRKFGMRIPVQLGYHFDFTNLFKFHIHTGPVLNVGFSNDYYLTSDKIAGVSGHIAGSVYNDNSIIPQFNRVDCQWRIGAGFQVQDIYIDLSGDIGMTNLIKDSHDGLLKYKENAFHLTIGYNF